MELVLVSSSLLGSPVRYDGTHKRPSSNLLELWVKEGRVVSVCPEVAGGLTIPRNPAEITAGSGGDAVLAGLARVIDSKTADITAAFTAGARYALHQARVKNVRMAVLKEGSPSCGTRHTYDGTFSGTRVPRRGVTAAILENAGIRVFSEEQLEEASEYLRALDAGRAMHISPGE